MSEPTELRVPLSAALAEAVRRIGMYEAWRIDGEFGPSPYAEREQHKQDVDLLARAVVASIAETVR